MLISSRAVTTPPSVLEADEDGLRFDAETVEAERISEDADYEGVRVTFVAYLERAKIPIQIDIGFGDIVTPAPSRTDYPTLLEFPGPRLLAYPKETVVAEKLEALVKLGIANTRMKDFYDLEVLFRTFAFEGKTLAQAIQNTFQKRGTDLPMGGLPVAFTSEFYDDLNKKRQWTAFCARNKSYVEETEFKAVMEAIRDFLALPVRTVQEGHSFTKTWKPGGPWR
jgi:Nucleotidyl transferase AbiEii toxin, Type IV TA system